MRTPRAEGVGSLIRPKEVRQAVAALFGSSTSAARSLVFPQRASALRDLTDSCDRAIRGLVVRQEEAGLDVVTDGELRRTIFLSSFYDALEGVQPAVEGLVGRDPEGNVAYTGYADPLIGHRLTKVAAPIAEEAAFLRALCTKPFKVTLPAPSYFFTEFVTSSPAAYSSRQELVEHVVELEKLLVAEAVAAGARWIQFDFPVYPALVDRHAERFAASLGESVSSLFDRAIAADAAVCQDLAPDTTTALHLCRGNLDGGFWDGSFAPIAGRLFELPFDRFLLEWDDPDRDGDFAAIGSLPAGKVLTLGLISSKRPVVEDEDEIVRQLDAAAQHVDLDQLALSPQCGFASVFDRDRGEQLQWKKLELVGRVANRVWDGTS
jgi:5-methyltetrahydropteroyltriglutamate--homocysteine methyltransferase